MIFRLITLPVTLFFSLLTLPFALLRMGFGVLGISSHLLLWPLKIFARHTILCLIVIGLLILYFAIKKDPHAMDQLKPAPAPTKQDKQVKGQPPVIEPVAKHENGDSVFATDLYATMTEPERQQYSAQFYQAMRAAEDGAAYEWQFYNINGKLTPIRTFKNNLGTTCRSFTETLKVHRIEQTLTGTACDNGGGTWCKLKPNATPQCGLGREHGPLEAIGNAVKSLF